MGKPLTVDWITECVASGDYILSRHADVERRNDGLSIDDLEVVLLRPTIVEDYFDDPRGSSNLVLGYVGDRPVHVVCGRNSDGYLLLITVYIPEMPKWKTPTERNHK